MTVGRPASRLNIEAVLAALKVFIAPGQVTELRALNVSTPRYCKPHTEAGFFDFCHLELMANNAIELTPYSSGIYFVMNPLRGDLLARRNNRVAVADSGSLAHDKDVLARRWLLIDCDPVRLDGISATDTEKAAARAVADRVQADLKERGWPAPIVADSGNGWHMFYSVNLPTDDGDLVKRFLYALASLRDTPAAKIDCKVFNPSRIVKLPGTLSRKGEDVPRLVGPCRRAGRASTCSAPTNRGVGQGGTARQRKGKNSTIPRAAAVRSLAGAG
jgi:hypothetical protein